MKQRLLTIAAATMVAAFTPTSRAALYTDTTGDIMPSNTILDITSVEVTNNFSDVIFKINLVGDPVATDWGKYCLGFVDTNAPTGDTSANGNGWGRAISLTQGMNYWVGTWVDGTMGAQLFQYSGTWNNIGGASVSKTTNSVTITLPIANLGKTYGDSFDFDVYTTGGGGGDPAIDSLANPDQTVSSWSTPYGTNLVKTYTLVVPPIPSTNHVKFTANMEIPIWELDNAIGNGFNTNSDTLFVRGSFNGWGSVNPSGYQLFQVGGSPLYTNTVEVVQYINQNVTYKFYNGVTLAYESPVLNCGNDRTLKITSQNMNAPTNYWSDRKLSDPTNYLTFKVDMSVARMFGQFDPTLGQGVTMPGNFNGWNNSIQPLSPGTDPDTNIYEVTLTYTHYPIGACNVGAYKFYISGNGAARDGGWEDPISTAGGNRNFSIGSSVQTNAYYYNDEIPYFNITSAQKLSPDAVKISWQSYPSRGNNIPIGGVYEIDSRSALNSGSWTSNGTVNSTATLSTFTNTGLTGTDQQFYQVILKGLVP